MKIIVAMAIILVSTSVNAQQKAAPSESEVATFGEWDALKSENMILELKIKNIELKNKFGMLNGDNAAPAAAVAAGTRTYTVQMVSGMGNNLSAILCTPGGSTVKVSKGSSVPGLGTIKSITSSEVTAGGSGGAISVPFGVDGTCTSPSTTMGTQPGMMGARQ